jgi:putative transposase
VHAIVGRLQSVLGGRGSVLTQAVAYCERLIGTIRRECLDFMIPLSEKHLRRILREWVRHYNYGRPHSSLGPGLPSLGPGLPIPAPQVPVPPQSSRHQIPQGWCIATESVLAGLRHEYRLERAAA